MFADVGFVTGCKEIFERYGPCDVGLFLLLSLLLSLLIKKVTMDYCQTVFHTHMDMLFIPHDWVPVYNLLTSFCAHVFCAASEEKEETQDTKGSWPS